MPRSIMKLIDGLHHNLLLFSSEGKKQHKKRQEGRLDMYDGELEELMVNHLRYSMRDQGEG